jgi:hypothetical protein
MYLFAFSAIIEYHTCGDAFVFVQVSLSALESLLSIHGLERRLVLNCFVGLLLQRGLSIVKWVLVVPLSTIMIILMGLFNIW